MPFYPCCNITVNNTEQDSDTTISSGKVIPYYDAEVAAGTNYAMEMAQTTPVGMIEIGGLLKDSEFAMRNWRCWPRRSRAATSPRKMRRPKRRLITPSC